MIPHFYHKLPGYFDFQDIYAEEVKNAPQGATFVELGTYCARSLAFMAVEIANSGKSIHCSSFDLWNGFSRQGTWTYEKIERAFSEAGVLPYVAMLQSDSALAASRFADGSVDFVFIDANHSLEGCLRDMRAWWPKMKPGATFAGHDYYDNNPQNIPKMWPGVRDAVKTFTKETGLPVVRRGTSWVMKKP